MKNELEYAYNLGQEFAEEINGTNERDHWHLMTENDDIPSFDYIALRDEYGDVGPAVEREYKRGFNEALAW